MQTELAKNDEDTIVFDYMYREVSAQSGRGVFEALQEFGEILYRYQIQKKKKPNKKVSIYINLNSGVLPLYIYFD